MISSRNGPVTADFLETARRLTADLRRANPTLYWINLCISTAVGYAALGVATHQPSLAVRLVSGIVSVFALYRALMFIHELMHLRPGAVPALWTAWNVLVGVPLLLPSFMYEDVHRLHHSKAYYGTKDDPKYLPLARTGLPAIIGLLLGSLLVPVLLLMRFAIVAPLAAASPAIRQIMVGRISSLTINPTFHRAPPQRAVGQWIVLEVAGVLYIWTALALLAAGMSPSSSFLTAIAVGAGISFVKQARTVVAHRWESDGRATNVIG